MPSKWDAEAERKLLLFVIKRCETKLETSVFDDAAAIFGGGFTGNACYQRFYKLKREADALIAKSTGGDGSSAGPSTPGPAKKAASKPKASAKSSAKSTGRGRKRKTSDDDDEENQVEETSDAEESPSKKVKGEDVKAEVVAEGDASQDAED